MSRCEGGRDCAEGSPIAPEEPLSSRCRKLLCGKLGPGFVASSSTPEVEQSAFERQKGERIAGPATAVRHGNGHGAGRVPLGFTAPSSRACTCHRGCGGSRRVDSRWPFARVYSCGHRCPRGRPIAVLPLLCRGLITAVQLLPPRENCSTFQQQAGTSCRVSCPRRVDPRLSGFQAKASESRHRAPGDTPPTRSCAAQHHLLTDRREDIYAMASRLDDVLDLNRRGGHIVPRLQYRQPDRRCLAMAKIIVKAR